VVEPKTIIDGATLGYKFYNWLSKRKYFKSFQVLRQLEILAPLHHGFSHSARKLARQMQDWDHHHSAATTLAVEVSTKCRESMAKLLNLQPANLHCCLKLMANEDGGRKRVGTWARSEPFDGRVVDEEPFFVDENTVWCSMFGCCDGSNQWSPDFTCFACNDLPKMGASFHCGRKNWSNYYKSTVVFPLRYAKSVDGSTLGNVGFLAFDSPKTNVFAGLPNIFKYREQPGDYSAVLHSSPIFHLGAIFSDTLGTFLGSAYESFVGAAR
jgi:hypothetical protein